VEAAPAAAPIRVAVVDDHPAIAQALEAAIAADRAHDRTGSLEATRGLEFVGAARTAEAGIELVRASGSRRPDVVLCDVQLQSSADGFAVVAAAKAAGCRPIVLTSFDRSSFMRAAFEQGAFGFLDKRSEMEVILRAIRVVAAGGTAFSATGLDAARTAPRPPSDRELAVLRELNRGATSEEIGVRLGISPRTVESHLRRLFDRYGVLSRTELALLSVREGWTDPEATGRPPGSRRSQPRRPQCSSVWRCCFA
jgi:two-component system response regulator DesR